jgi:hypothetical protein
MSEFDEETRRLLDGYDDGDTCEACGADISDREIGLDLCRDCEFEED